MTVFMLKRKVSGRNRHTLCLKNQEAKKNKAIFVNKADHRIRFEREQLANTPVFHFSLFMGTFNEIFSSPDCTAPIIVDL
jgi:hypothetical protein